ncbi:MAG: DUF1232 domain-containing protein [Nanoarchaeota archaeon]|nr:DUF1232 domain-containing protein [Nanoarchaeota archaeon]
MIEKKRVTLLERFKSEIQFYQAVLKDSRTPKLTKFFLGLAVAYALNPIDLIPDFIPVVGYLDDLIIIPVLIFIAMKLIPRKLLQEIRKTEHSNNLS